MTQVGIKRERGGGKRREEYITVLGKRGAENSLVGQRRLDYIQDGTIKYQEQGNTSALNCESKDRVRKGDKSD